MEITASEAAGVVREGFDNVGPEALQHLFGQIAGPLVAASAIAALVSAVMVRKQIIRLEEAIEGTLETTAFTASGLSISLAVESVLSSLVYVATPAAVVAGIGGRILIKRWYSGRQSLLESLREENADLSIIISRIFPKPHSDKSAIRQHQA